MCYASPPNKWWRIKEVQMSKQRLIASIVGAILGLALPLMGMSSISVLMTVYWTVVLMLLGAYVCQELKGYFKQE